MENTEMTATELRSAIDEIFIKRGMAAAQSQYDRSVCIRAVATARDAFESVPVEGKGAEFGRAVASALTPLYENYNDPDGEFTSGRSLIGDVIHDINNLVGSRTNNGTLESDDE